MPCSTKNTFHIIYLCAIIFAWLCGMIFIPGTQADVYAIVKNPLYALILLPAGALVVVKLLTRKHQAIETDPHLKERLAMKSLADKAALRYQSLLEEAGDAIFVINAKTGLLEEMNDMATVLLGYSREEMGALKGRDLFPRTDRPRFTSLVRRVNRRGIAASDSLVFLRKEGTQFAGEVKARLIDLGDEKVVQAIVRDITQKKQSEQEIRKRNHKLSILNSIIARANSTLDLHTILDVTLRETMDFYSAEAGTIHLLEEEGQTFMLFATNSSIQDHSVVATQVNFSSDVCCTMEKNIRCSRLAGTSLPVCELARQGADEGLQSVVGIPLVAKDRLIGIMHVMKTSPYRYVTEDVDFLTTMGNQIGIVVEHARMFAELQWKTAELLRSHRLLEKNTNQLALSENRLRKNLALVERANVELERLDRMKSHFLGMVSHEFKTPLTGILGSAEFLLANRGNVGEDEERLLLSIIQKGGTRLNEIVSDLLKLARLEAQGSTISTTPLHLREILKLLMEQFAPLLRERNQQIVFEGVEALPYFSGDRECLYEVFTELLENAVKFTPDGGTTLIAAKVIGSEELGKHRETLDRFNPTFYEQMGDTGYLQVEVRDSGVGVATEEQLKIFDSFYEVGDIRHHSSGRHKFMGKGVGLGLAIVKGLIEAHGGMVWVESAAKESAGSAFFLLIPLEEGPGQSLFPFMQQDNSPLSTLRSTCRLDGQNEQLTL